MEPRYEEGTARFLWWRWPVMVKTRDGVSDGEVLRLEAKRDRAWRCAT